MNKKPFDFDPLDFQRMKQHFLQQSQESNRAAEIFEESIKDTVPAMSQNFEDRDRFQKAWSTWVED